MLISRDQKVTTRAQATRRAAPRYSTVRERVLLAGHFLAFASGATALVYEVLWTRQFVSLFGATAPAISATLAAIFLGLAAGNAVVGRRYYLTAAVNVFVGASAIWLDRGLEKLSPEAQPNHETRSGRRRERGRPLDAPEQLLDAGRNRGRRRRETASAHPAPAPPGGPS